MKLNFKKTGVIAAACSALFATSVMAETTFYGKIGVELGQTSSKASKSANSVGGLALRDGGNIIGLKGTKGNVTGNLEFGIASINPPADVAGTKRHASARHANVMIDLGGGRTLGIGQQNNVGVVASGWLSNAWNYHVSSFHSEVGTYRVNGARFTGVSYKQGFGAGSFAIMAGIDATDDGSGTGATKKAQTALDKISLGVTVGAGPATVKLAYNKSEGDLAKNPASASGTGLSVGGSVGKAAVTFGYFMTEANVASDAKAKNASSGFALNASFNAGKMTPFVGMLQVTHDNKNSSGKKVDSKATSGMTVGANYSVLGAASYFAYNSLTNKGGTEGADWTDIATGLFYSF